MVIGAINYQDNAWWDLGSVGEDVKAVRHVESNDRSLIATTGPRGGLVLIWDTVKLKLISKRSIPDVCGAGQLEHDF